VQSRVAPNLPHTLVTFTNPAERIQQEQSLTHTQRLAGLGTLTASIAHELTNPISIITTTCHAILQDMADKSLDDTQLTQYTQMIERSAWRCIRLTDTLRGYTHQGKLQLAITNFAALVDDALLLVQQQFLKEFNVDISTELDTEHQTIVCDPNRLTQVLVNLLTNARDALQPAGGHITIRSWFIPPADLDERIPVDHLPETITAVGAFAFAIEDSGSGIDPAILDNIFSPFFTTKQSGSGTGLGLYIAREIVELHNGRLLAENIANAGARFTILLPQQ
jgi:histidine kinase